MSVIEDSSNEVAEKIALLNREYKRKLVSNELQILRPYLQAMEEMAALQTINKKAQPFALAMMLSSIGIYKSKSALGMIGPGVEAVFRSLEEAVAKIAPNHPTGERKLLLKSALFFTISMMAGAAIGANEGLASAAYPDDAADEINTFGLELFLQTAVYSDLPYFICQAFAKSCNYSKEQIAPIIVLAALLLTIWTISREKGPRLENVLIGLRPKLKEYFDQVESLFDKLIDTNKIEAQDSQKVMICLKQLKTNLNGTNTEKLILSIEAALKLCGVTPKQITDDIEELTKQIKIIFDILNDQDDDALNAVTGIWQTG